MRKPTVAILLAAAVLLLVSGPIQAGSPNGSAGQMPAFYDGVRHTINLKMQPANAARNLLAHNKSVNHIFQSVMANGQPFVDVIDAIQGDGFNPLWQEVDITFLTIAPKQFTSDTEISDAALRGEISLTFTNEVYRCSVVKSKK